MGVLCVLPARLPSTRIPKKPLQQLAGAPLLEWSWRAAQRIVAFDSVVVATESEEVKRCARSFGAEVVRTRPDHACGTDRVAETARLMGASDDDVIVNFQADEPFVDGETVEAAIHNVREVATLAAPIMSDEELHSPAIVKVVRASGGRALYFSRSPIPYHHAETSAPRLRHIGVYAYRLPHLQRWASLPPSELERTEGLEQLRALEANMHLHVEVGPWTEPGIDIPADLRRAERLLARRSRNGRIKSRRPSIGVHT